MCELLSTVIIIETFNKPNHQIQKPQLLVTQPHIRENIKIDLKKLVLEGVGRNFSGWG
jgi:hypothetical protein